MPTWRFVITMEASDRDDALVRFADLFEAGIPPEAVVAGPGETRASAEGGHGDPGQGRRPRPHGRRARTLAAYA